MTTAHSRNRESTTTTTVNTVYICYSDTVSSPLLTATLFQNPNGVSVIDISDIHSIVEMITKLRHQVSCGQAGSARRAGSAADAQDVQR